MKALCVKSVKLFFIIRVLLHLNQLHIKSEATELVNEKYMDFVKTVFGLYIILTQQVRRQGDGLLICLSMECFKAKNK